MSRCFDSCVASAPWLSGTVAIFRPPRICNPSNAAPLSNDRRQTPKLASARATAGHMNETGLHMETDAQNETLFNKLGGGPAVKAAVDIFYDKMMADPRVNYFFNGIDMKKQRAHQASFLTYAMGGAQSYEGNGDMTAAHARLARDLDMRMEHFDIVLEHLGGALRDLHVPEEDIGEAAALVETLRPAFQVAINQAAA